MTSVSLLPIDFAKDRISFAISNSDFDLLLKSFVPYFHWGCLPSSNSEEIWGAKKISLHGRERHPARQITDLRQSATLSCPLECKLVVYIGADDCLRKYSHETYFYLFQFLISILTWKVVIPMRIRFLNHPGQEKKINSKVNRHNYTKKNNE